jgi:DNA-binding transcriptional regulator YiaG
MASINVRQVMDDLGIDCEELADRMGVHVRTVKRWGSKEADMSPLAIHRLRQVVYEHRHPRPATQTPTSNALTKAIV